VNQTFLTTTSQDITTRTLHRSQRLSDNSHKRAAPISPAMPAKEKPATWTLAPEVLEVDGEAADALPVGLEPALEEPPAADVALDPPGGAAAVVPPAAVDEPPDTAVVDEFKHAVPPPPCITIMEVY